MTTPCFPPEARILVVDDTISIHEDFRKILGRPIATTPALMAAHLRLFGGASTSPTATRFTIDCVAQGQEGLACVQRAVAEAQPYSIAFVDMRMPPGWDGIETVRHLWAADPLLQVVLCTAYSDHTWEQTIMQLGPSDSLLILKKPFDNIEVLQLAHALSAKWTTTRRQRERLANLDEAVRQRTAELRDAEGRFAQVFRANPVPNTLQRAADGCYLDANPAFLELVGWPRESVIGHTAAELGLWPNEDLWQTALESLNHGESLRARAAHLHPREGAPRDVLVTATKLESGGEGCVLSSLEDVTDRLALEKQFQQAQKMEAVGQLAAGVAHDFNNLLTVIQTYSSIVSDSLPADSEDRENLRQVGVAAERAAALTRQLLLFSRRQIADPRLLDVAAVLGRLKEILRRLLPENIALECDCAPDVPPIVADEANLEQVIMNLAVNARDAMPEGGRLSLGVERVALGPREAARHPDARPGEFLHLAVRDTGTGMSPEIVAHIFEPFFTTKDVGKGTGLGLSTVYAIVRQHAGWIEVASSPGTGTRFDVYLPAPPEKIDHDESFRGRKADSHLLRGRGERILLVEDEPSVREATRAIVAQAGYDVTAAQDGPTAIGLYANSPGFDLLLTDMIMPNHCTGLELATELRARDAKLKVIITTGYSNELLDGSERAPAGTRLLLKPFNQAALLGIIRETLEGTPSAVSPALPIPG